MLVQAARRCAMALIFGAISGASVAPAHAQVPQALISDPAKATTALVFALQTGDRPLLYSWLGSDLLTAILKLTGGTGIEPQLKGLGSVLGVEITPILTDTTGKSFNARVKHQNGLSSWTIVLDRATDRLTTATFQIAPGGTPTVATAPPPAAPRPNTKFDFHSLSHNGQLGSIVGNTFTKSGTIASISPPRPNATITWAIDPAPPSPTARPTLAPPVLPAAPALPAYDPRVVEFLFATTRQLVPQAATTPPTPVSFSGERNTANPNLTYGIASIRIPDDHRIGRIEMPYKWTLFGFTITEQGLQPQKHFMIRQIATLSPEQWGSVIHAKAPKRALIFVHGFNTSFQDAVFRNAQIIWDLQYPGLSVLFTWASRGQTSEYLYDRDSAYNARAGFLTLLKTLKETYGIEQVDVLAHSMGNLVVLDALSTYAQTVNPVKISELIMAAPDVDRNQFEQMIPEVHKITGGMTLYASSADKALQLSRLAAGVPRAGDVTADGPMILTDLETIDVTAIGDELLGLNHTEFAENRVVIDDIKLILSTGMRPPNSRLSQIRAFPELPAPAKYWRYAN